MNLTTQTLCPLLSANERWEIAQTNNQKKISHLNLGMAGTGGAAVCGSITSFGIATLCAISFHPEVATLFYMSITIPPLLILKTVAGMLSYKNSLTQRIWTLGNVDAFESKIKSTSLETLDLTIKDLAKKAGIISKENHHTWCELINEKRKLDSSKTWTLNYTLEPTVLSNDLAEKQQLYVQKHNELSSRWDKLKESLLADLPVQAIEDIV